jgi:hypothetical protein
MCKFKGSETDGFKRNQKNDFNLPPLAGINGVFFCAVIKIYPVKSI